jgi:hypothetical protein
LFSRNDENPKVIRSSTWDLLSDQKSFDEELQLKKPKKWKLMEFELFERQIKSFSTRYKSLFWYQMLDFIDIGAPNV